MVIIVLFMYLSACKIYFGLDHEVECPVYFCLSSISILINEFASIILSERCMVT